MGVNVNVGTLTNINGELVWAHYSTSLSEFMVPHAGVKDYYYYNLGSAATAGASIGNDYILNYESGDRVIFNSTDNTPQHFFDYFDPPKSGTVVQATILNGTQKITTLGSVTYRNDIEITETATFNLKFAEASVTPYGPIAIVDGPDGSHRAVAALNFQFSDGIIKQSDGNALVDDLYYYSYNKDVFAAGADAESHYASFGFGEGRDPNALFSSSGYLAANADVKAAGVNPLTHYDQNGWKEGRDPSAYFDNERYLAANPDVKAAGVDPLLHYLENGQVEGRATFTAVGRAADIGAAHGFDAEFYLLANTDVAKAALVAGGNTFDFAYRHYETHGWREGRDPNAVFDTKGYLAAYGDVAAANIDPLAHYDTNGWKEGRDPSTSFDTKSYLAASPDVKAAAIDPMVHYLQYGAVEGRGAFGDGHFG